MTDRWTAETEELVVAAKIYHRTTTRDLGCSGPERHIWRCSCGSGRDESAPARWGVVRDEAHAHEDRAILTALADAGLLLPPGGETREEFRVVYNHRLGHPVIWSAGPWTRCEDAEASRQKAIAVGYADAAIQKRTIGPWVPVNDGGGT